MSTSAGVRYVLTMKALGCYCMFLCLCLYYVSWISADSWACLRPSSGEYVCWTYLCLWIPQTFLSCSHLSGCLCVSALNEYSHRINSRMIKQLQLSTCVKHRAESKRRRERTSREWRDTIKGKTRDNKNEDKRIIGVRKKLRIWGRCISLQWLVWETRGAPTSLFSLPWMALLPSVCIGRKETDEGFTVRSWLVHIPGVVFLPSAPRPYQRPLKQQAVRLWQLASNSSYSSPAPRFPASPWSCVCLCVHGWMYVCVCVCVSVCGWVAKCLFGLYMRLYSSLWWYLCVSITLR